jgi:hypothetical protein
VLTPAAVEGATCSHQEKVIVEITIVVMERQLTGVSEPEPSAETPAETDSIGEVAVDTC